jgi:hypothetical protein
MKVNKLDESVFLNVDLEVFSKSDLKPLADALGRSLHAHYLGMEFGKHKAYFDLAKQPDTPDGGIVRYCKLIQKLPPKVRKLWDSSESRSFDIGLESPKKGRYYWGAISQEAVRAAADVGAQIAITVYGPMKVAKPARRKQRSSPTK